jgi:hypothetical protein
MLIKSIKHDLLATYRDFVALYLVLFVMAVTAPLLLATRMEWLVALMIVSFAFITIAIMVVTFISIVRLYARRLYSSEGYLTLTLPVSTMETLISKIITGLIWSIVTFLVFVVAFLAFSAMFYLVFNGSKWEEILVIFSVVRDIWESGYLWPIVRTLLIQIPLMLGSTLYSLTLLLFIVTLVHTSFIKKHRLPLGLLIYYVISNVLSVIMTMVLMPLLMNSSGLSDLSMVFSGVYYTMNDMDFLINWPYYGTQLAMFLLLVGLLSYASWWLMEKKLEIE